MNFKRYQARALETALPTDKPPCKIIGCSQTPRGQGYCQSHYMKLWRRGLIKTNYKRYADPEESFLARIQQRGECIEWIGGINSCGYGNLRVNGRKTQAHRYAWERTNGPIPEHLYIDHICHNRKCVNVDHLRLATHQENTFNRSGPQPGTKAKYRGVTWKNRERKWLVRFIKDGVTYSGGYFTDLEDAKAKADSLRKEIFGEFAGKA